MEEQSIYPILKKRTKRKSINNSKNIISSKIKTKKIKLWNKNNLMKRTKEWMRHINNKKKIIQNKEVKKNKTKPKISDNGWKNILNNLRLQLISPLTKFSKIRINKDLKYGQIHNKTSSKIKK